MLLGEHPVLPLRELQAELLHIVARIADLMCDSEGDEDIGLEIAVHVCMKVAAEFVVAQNVGLENCLIRVPAIVLRLTHQSFGDGRNGRFALDPSVGINIRDFCIRKTEDVDLAVFCIDVAGHFAARDRHAVFIRAQRKIAEAREVADEIARVMVRGLQFIEQAVAVTVEIDDHVFFIVEKQAAKI